MLRDSRPGLRAVVPTVGAVSADVSAAIKDWAVPAFTVLGEAEKYDAFAASNAALAASGTVSLELAMARVPTVIAYRVSALTAWVARRVVRIRFASLVNIILDREIIPERLQEACTPIELANAVENLLDDKTAAAGQSDAALEALIMLGYGGSAPSRRAAQTILDVVRESHGRG
jgi:lipid-A-disaccharide synthase